MKRIIKIGIIIATIFLLTGCVNTYTVSFNTNGGNDIQSITGEEGNGILEPALPLQVGIVIQQ
jgi:predicted small secreted protein